MRNWISLVSIFHLLPYQHSSQCFQSFPICVIFHFINFSISFFIRNHNGNRVWSLFCDIHGNKINLPSSINYIQRSSKGKPYSCGIRLSHFLKYLVFQMKHQCFDRKTRYLKSKILKYQVLHTLNLKYQVFRAKYLVFRKLGISTKKPVRRRYLCPTVVFVCSICLDCN